MSKMSPNYQLLQEMAGTKSELVEANKRNKQLREALQDLYNEQNGPPLLRHEKSYEAAMAKAGELLKEQEE